jgi:hypothetical protein
MQIVADILWWSAVLERNRVLTLPGIPKMGDQIELNQNGTFVWLEVVTVVWKADGSVYLKLFEARPT